MRARIYVFKRSPVINVVDPSLEESALEVNAPLSPQLKGASYAPDYVKTPSD